MANENKSRSALELFRFKGIRVRVHWSFALLIGWVLFAGVAGGMDKAQLVQEVAFVLLIFTCVVLHEFGHALTALHFGIRTRHITLLPIGGVASLERIPEKPGQELLVAIAGPAVNLVIGGVLAVGLLLVGAPVLIPDPANSGAGPVALVQGLIMANGALLLFNLIPAFPMDGGRVLRALLAYTMDRVKATRIAAIAGRICAVGFLLIAFYYKQPMLGLIALFVFAGGTAEQKMVETEHALRAVRVRDVMRTRYWSMLHDRTVQEAADELLAGGDHVLFLTRNGAFDRAIPRASIISAVQQGQQQLALSELAGTVPEPVEPDMIAKEAYARLNGQPLSMLPVVEHGRLVGVLEADNLAEYLELHERPAPTT